MTNKNTVLQAIDICKDFYDPVKIRVLNHVSFNILKGEFISIIGKSGCGKSTLLYILSTMDTVYDGDILLNGNSLKNRSNADLAKVRNESIGFVFQFHYLLAEFNVLHNIMLPALKLNKFSRQEIEHRAMERLRQLGVEDQALKMPGQLSGGQKQRIAIARALINDPAIIMGDEPTGNLDKYNSDLVFDLLSKLTHEFGQTMLIVTHDNDFARRTDRIIEMQDGKIISENQVV
ncbi:MAG: ABC transporter ATP-binding protein [Flavobacteriales bacterium]|nr:ABC transporter ATP-binding protein [Flavobacteriales bacterium]